MLAITVAAPYDHPAQPADSSEAPLRSGHPASLELGLDRSQSPAVLLETANPARCSPCRILFALALAEGLDVIVLAAHIAVGLAHSSTLLCCLLVQDLRALRRLGRALRL